MVTTALAIVVLAIFGVIWWIIWRKRKTSEDTTNLIVGSVKFETETCDENVKFETETSDENFTTSRTRKEHVDIEFENSLSL